MKVVKARRPGTKIWLDNVEFPWPGDKDYEATLILYKARYAEQRRETGEELLNIVKGHVDGLSEETKKYYESVK